MNPHINKNRPKIGRKIKKHIKPLNILIIGKWEPTFFKIERRNSARGSISKPGTQSEDDDDKKSSYIHDSQVYMEIFCGLLEKLYHIYRWERPQITTTIVICLSLSKQRLTLLIRRRLKILNGHKNYPLV